MASKVTGAKYGRTPEKPSGNLTRFFSRSFSQISQGKASEMSLLIFPEIHSGILSGIPPGIPPDIPLEIFTHTPGISLSNSSKSFQSNQ